MYPVAHVFPHRSLPASVPPALQRSLQTTIDAYNSRIYAATLVSARRTLEGIFKYRLIDAKPKTPLYKLIEQVAADSDLSKPLISLSHAIRDGGNLGAHFDDEREATADIARQMVTLLNYLIDYLYVLPEEIEKLEVSLSSDDGSSDSTEHAGDEA